MITANDLRVGMTVEIKGVMYIVEEFQHVKRGRGGAFVRCRLKNIETLENIRKVFQPEERIKNIFVEEKKVQFLYRKGDNFHFMDLENFEEKVIPRELLKDKLYFLKENMEVTLRLGEGKIIGIDLPAFVELEVKTLRLGEGKIIGIDLPAFVELEVKRSSPGVKGNTVGSATKIITLESGYDLRVPLFIKEGDMVRIDTRSREYISKA